MNIHEKCVTDALRSATDIGPISLSPEDNNNITDWFIKESLQQRNAGTSQNDKKRLVDEQTKDFITNELNTLSKLSLYDSNDKINCESEPEDCDK